MRAIVTVVGKDRVGIIAEICVLLSSFGVNILDINQTVMQEFFTMSMLVDTTQATVEFGDLVENLSKKGEEMGMKIRVNREDLFNAMHKI
ncbi:MAG: ACT domain-containing protein [Oscillospiraceae bacterium]|nr:ACT domain-containing protein [Oscillospiraceae bacterium]